MNGELFANLVNCLSCFKKSFHFFCHQEKRKSKEPTQIISSQKKKKTVKKQIYGRKDVTVNFRILDDEKEKKATFKLHCEMKIYERDGKYSIGVTVDETNRNDFQHLQSLIREKVPTEEIKKLLPTSFSPEDFCLISESDFGDKV